MSRKLDDLSPVFRPLAVEFLARCVEEGICVVIVDTLRTEAEQQENLRKGVSWTNKSKHLTGDAIDIVPYAQYAAHGEKKVLWDAEDPLWARLGKIGESCGMKWGGRFGPPAKPDYGHFELRTAVKGGDAHA